MIHTPLTRESAHVPLPARVTGHGHSFYRGSGELGGKLDDVTRRGLLPRQDLIRWPTTVDCAPEYALYEVHRL